MSSAILADASALVALWSPSDRYHEWAKGCFAKYSPPIFTCEAVMTEAAWLLRQFPARRAALLAAWRRDVLTIEFQAQTHRDALVTFDATVSRHPHVLRGFMPSPNERAHT